MRYTSSLLHSRTFVILDTETTGLYPEGGDEVVELAAEKLVRGEVVETFHAFLRPTRPVPPDAVAIHGLADDYLRQHGQDHNEVFPRFATFIAGTVLVGHNIRRFDMPFIAAHFQALDLRMPDNELCDTLELAREYLTLPNYKLGTVAAHFNIPTAGAHRAAADVSITRQVLLRFLELSARPIDTRV
ncbi:hypothetical protein A3E96_02840 [Candidatus Uhrbacteria bacterium RIFCSPHIGHO2_12_FULL_46_13]|uniref:Exonuclease domain-containing protein n=1 Tax=Candidatus Uhrbacteria bacterium RIFCSPLOWO2_01_FULL_47_25 TaxID=1802402 RepID=A0A1F7UXW3_9BACT|nr:MAG: hypothetical protein A2752_02845 [Candidatus Uhrbacteria bacterium RIFCSPHIGHO2_01_FULL_46_23]OGL70580.1 MAG: hypothetical protein A3D60_03860 [Candidatus Uhrbacteria bacterium RIFCSPHIGHO2_02_FULL_47_29]OGL74885.1 MAG: hypothetical protein A3E96_02840 [Candidatus Uhrbacteria bacterium RIFCSPHIGHO2_12_FULL_46_13]OGL83113.1 MAG: hypothetical protein A2936_05365 [Candidatus Uhrbacteria bacterium RIFCSPLOWO2_01_FULL_47_25]OGL84483.1 MAG: hypothetical protein A3I37_03730 [Candidatus Uhrbact